MFDEEQLGEYIDSRFSATLFRLETLDRYDVGSNGDDYERYLAGEPGPTMSRKGPWMEHIRGEVARGLYTNRVHVVRGPLTDYLRFEFEWGYVYNAEAGERIRIVDLAEQPYPDGLLDEDFWVIDGRDVVRMFYDAEGSYLGAEPVPDADKAGYLRCETVAWAAGVAFADYWRTHPQYWRDTAKPPEKGTSG